MPILKKFTLYFVRSLLVTFLLVLPTAFLCTFVFSQPTQVTQLIRQSGVYEVASHTIVTTTVSSLVQSGQTYGLSQAAITRAAQKAFPASDIRRKVETNITNVYAWLNGKNVGFTLAFTIDSNQKVFTQALADEVSSSITEKPACSDVQTLQFSSLDITSLLQAACRPAGFDPSYIQQLFSEAAPRVAQDPANPLTIVSQLPQSSSINPQAAYTVNPQLLFGLFKNSFYIVSGFLLILLLLNITLLRRLRVCLLSIAKPLSIAGVILLFYAGLTQWALDQHLIAKIFSNQGEIAQAVGQPFALLSIHANFYFGIGFIVCAIILFIVYRLIKPSPTSSTLPRDTQPAIPPVT